MRAGRLKARPKQGPVQCPLLSDKDEPSLSCYLLVIRKRDYHACQGVVDKARIAFPGKLDRLPRQAHGCEYQLAILEMAGDFHVGGHPAGVAFDLTEKEMVTILYRELFTANR